MTDTPKTPRFATQAIHAGASPDPATGARAQPIYFTNGFVFDSTEQAADIFNMRRTGFSYSRGSNPTVAALERRVAALEGAKAAVNINKELVKVLSSPDMKKRFAAECSEVIGNSHEEAVAVQNRQIEELADLIRKTDIKLQ